MFEYEYRETDTRHLQSVLGEWAAKGWRVVSVLTVPLAGAKVGIIFERTLAQAATAAA